MCLKPFPKLNRILSYTMLANLKFELKNAHIIARIDEITKWQITPTIGHISTTNQYIATFAPEEQIDIFLREAIENSRQVIQDVVREDDELKIILCVPHINAIITFYLQKIECDDVNQVQYHIHINKGIRARLRQLNVSAELHGYGSRVIVHNLTNEDIRNDIYYLCTFEDEMERYTFAKKESRGYDIKRGNTTALYSMLHEKSKDDITHGIIEKHIYDMHPPQMLVYVDVNGIAIKIEFRGLVLDSLLSVVEHRKHVQEMIYAKGSNIDKIKNRWVVKIPDYIYHEVIFPRAIYGDGKTIYNIYDGKISDIGANYLPHIPEHSSGVLYFPPYVKDNWFRLYGYRQLI